MINEAINTRDISAITGRFVRLLELLPDDAILTAEEERKITECYLVLMDKVYEADRAIPAHHGAGGNYKSPFETE